MVRVAKVFVRTLPSVSDLAKGKVKVTELYVTNALEAYAAEQAGIDMQIVSFKKDTLRTGIPTNKWFRDAHIKDIREAAPNTFMIYGLGQMSSPEKVIDAALIARDNGADAVYCGNSPKYIEALRNEGLPAVSHIGLIPYKSTWTGGFKAVGKDAISAYKVYQDALAYDQAGAIGLEVECVPDRVAEIITKKVNLLTLSMGSGPKCDVEFLFIQDVIGTNTDRVPRHAKVFKDTNKSYEKLLDDTIEGLKNFIKDVNTKKFPTPSNIVEIKDDDGPIELDFDDEQSFEAAAEKVARREHAPVRGGRRRRYARKYLYLGSCTVRGYGSHMYGMPAAETYRVPVPRTRNEPKSATVARARVPPYFRRRYGGRRVPPRQGARHGGRLRAGGRAHVVH